ncbi:MAG: hypothetical protein HY040_14160 [Planctomycetes bacterium]|nr:hypothetical protein [Planctomycetota bacterium]
MPSILGLQYSLMRIAHSRIELAGAFMEIELFATHEGGHAVMQWFVDPELRGLQMTIEAEPITSSQIAVAADPSSRVT